MGAPVPRQLRSWGDEVGVLIRRWWWVAALVLRYLVVAACSRGPGRVHYRLPGARRAHRILARSHSATDTPKCRGQVEA